MPPAPFQGDTKNLFQEKTMRRFRQLSMASVLALVLAPGAFAGIIGTVPGPLEPPPASVPETIEAPPAVQPAATDPVVDLVLDLMQTVLTLL